MSADFCKYCGASIPGREGEGRCQHCMGHMAGTPVKLYTLDWGDRFIMPPREGAGACHTVFTLERGNGMYPWVSWLVDGDTMRSGMYIGEEVIPL